MILYSRMLQEMCACTTKEVCKSCTIQRQQNTNTKTLNLSHSILLLQVLGQCFAFFSLRDLLDLLRAANFGFVARFLSNSQLVMLILRDKLKVLYLIFRCLKSSLQVYYIVPYTRTN